MPLSSRVLSYRSTNRLLVGVCVLGVWVSSYALFVEVSAEGNSDYVAMCDISERASCSRVLTSKYAKGFGLFSALADIPNSAFGIIFYCLMIFLTLFDQLVIVRTQLFFSMAAVVMSFYLAFLLIFVLHDICVVCISTYIINITLAALVYYKLKGVLAKNK